MKRLMASLMVAVFIVGLLVLPAVAAGAAHDPLSPALRRTPDHA